MTIDTVRENMNSYTRREVERAEDARELITIIGRLCEDQMKRVLDEPRLKDCTMSRRDVVNSRNIFGPDVRSLKEKTTRRKELHIELVTPPVPVR